MLYPALGTKEATSGCACAYGHYELLDVTLLVLGHLCFWARNLGQ